VSDVLSRALRDVFGLKTAGCLATLKKCINTNLFLLSFLVAKFNFCVTFIDLLYCPIYIFIIHYTYLR